MNSSISRICLACLLAVLLSGAAYISWTLIRATTSYRNGDYPAATAAWQRLSALVPGSAGIAFNSGVTQYRQREYRTAAEQFSRVIRGKDPLITAAAHYNLGNCFFRQGDDLAARDKGAAAEFYKQAAEQYELALALDSADSDTKFNLASARNRLQAVRTSLNGQPGQKPGPGSRGKEGGQTENGRTKGKPARGNRDAAEMKRASTGDQTHDSSSTQATKGGPKGTSSAEPLRMSRKDAEALLQEHRRTGGATSFFRDSGTPGHPAEVLKDW